MGDLFRLTWDETHESARADLHDDGFDDERNPDLDVKDHLCRHLWDHGVLLSSTEFYALSVEQMQALDPCPDGAA